MSQFFDAEDGGPLRLELRSVDGRDFTVLRRIGYRAKDHGDPFVFPADLDRFRTDLASVPRVFTWLVPRSGDFLPAVVLHDALITPGDYLGPRIDRTEADLIFRQAMIDLGTGRVRAWLMWSAAATTTMWRSGQWSRRVALVLLLGVVTVLGALATVDLLDLAVLLPWMGERELWVELAAGALFAVLVPALLSFTWGEQRLAGLIIGVALAFLLHVTLVLLALYAAYLTLERLVSGPKVQVR